VEWCPDPGREFSVKGDITTGSRHRLDTKVTFDVPFTDWILSTLSFSTQKQTGYQHRIPYVQANINGSAGIPDCTTATCPYITDALQQFPAAGYQTSSDEGGINKWSGRAKVVSFHRRLQSDCHRGLSERRPAGIRKHGHRYQQCATRARRAVWSRECMPAGRTHRRAVHTAARWPEPHADVAVIDASYNPPREWFATFRYRPRFGGGK
jgi:hypothetical protein